ncbi:MAG: alcohol dehydrogenase catalytic domain-containing protein [Candidatus Eremiobacteraeota bacterium]|nr:alcohol dehydrogenase catalytic domain-containing protein [Candidatus Eremiobacteraeota bacterium]MBV9409618.1 alcohol dehydrogenase catalytic domain-containing protein [Candidatus Eremiobacteraeota bacterium]
MAARAVLADGRGGFGVRAIEIDAPGPEEVRVRIGASGVCHTDLDHLRAWYDVPTVLGHEGAGTVVDVGDDVIGVRPGDRVVLNWAIPCGRCFFCRDGAEHLCEARPVVAPEKRRADGRPLPASFGLGTMATHALVPRSAVVTTTVDVPMTSACIVGCAVATGFCSAVNAARVAPDETVAVIGVGGVGLNVVQGARYAGAGRIVAVDVEPRKLEFARVFGATDVVLASRDDDGLAAAAVEVRALFDGRGADVAFECTAIPRLGAAPLAMVRNGGRALGVSGIEQIVPIDMQLFEWDKTYLNPLYGQCSPRRDIPRILGLYATGALRLDELVTCTYALDDVARAFDDLELGVNAKGVLVTA